MGKDNYKEKCDVNYLDTIHHRQEVINELGSIMEHPEDIWVERLECLVLSPFNHVVDLKTIPCHEDDLEEDFITLKDISDSNPDGYFKVICESPLGGVIYRYNNNGKHEWMLVGIMYGYA